MTDYEISVKEMRPFNVRIRTRLYIALVMPVIVLVSSFVQEQWAFGIIVGSVVFLLLFLPRMQRHVVFITKIVVKDDILAIEYKNISQDRRISGHVKDFEFKTRGWYGKDGYFVNIYYKGNHVLKQYDIDEWTKYRLEQVITMFKDKS